MWEQRFSAVIELNSWGFIGTSNWLALIQSVSDIEQKRLPGRVSFYRSLLMYKHERMLLVEVGRRGSRKWLYLIASMWKTIETTSEFRVIDDYSLYSVAAR